MDYQQYYRTKDGQADYLFCFSQLRDYTWRIYILSQPDYRGRDTGPHPTHRFSDSRGHYICWSCAITNFNDALEIAARWADNTQEYIKTGKPF